MWGLGLGLALDSGTILGGGQQPPVGEVFVSVTNDSGSEQIITITDDNGSEQRLTVKAG